MGMDDSASFFNTLLSALGISQLRPTPQRYEFTDSDPMGGESVKVTEEDGLKQGEVSGGGASVEHIKMSSVCEDLMCQVQKLKSVEDNILALSRVNVGAQVLVARHVTLMLIASLSTEQSGNLAATLQRLGLLGVKPLVRLLRLVDAGRIDGTPGKSFVISLPSHIYPVSAVQCLSDALASVVTSDGTNAGLQLMQSCCRDLFTAAVGGEDLVQEFGKWRPRRLGAQVHFRKYEDSDLSVLGNPNLKVSQRLVKILAKSATKLVSKDSLMVGVVLMMDALTACLFSLKLGSDHRLWAIQQLVKIFAVTGASEITKKSSSQKQKKGMCSC